MSWMDVLKVIVVMVATTFCIYAIFVDSKDGRWRY